MYIAGHYAGKSARVQYTLRETAKRTPFDAPTNIEAHHVLPDKFADKVCQWGINVHNPKYGAWWDAAIHRAKSTEYNNLWVKWFLDYPNATVEQVLAFGKDLARHYGFTIHF